MVLDIGAGTGISAELLLKAGVTNLSLIEPSTAMLEQAVTRLGGQVQYHQLYAEELNHEFNANVDLAYALNTFHLFADLSRFLANIACALKPGGVFVFNISSPTYSFNHLDHNELEAIKANKIFYEKLNQIANNEVLLYTIELLNKILAHDLTGVFTEESIEQIFASVGMRLEANKEVIIKMNANYQRNIWSMMAQSFVEDSAKITTIIDSIKLPEELEIRQALFKFVNAE